MMSLRTISVKYLLPLHFLILSYSCSTIPLDTRTNPSVNFNIEGKFKLTYLEFKESGYFVLKKKTNSIALTLGKNYLLPEKTFLFDTRESILLSEFLGKDENNLKPISFRVYEFLNLFFGIKSEEIMREGIEIAFEPENKEELPSKIMLSNDKFKLIFLISKNEPY